MEDSIIPQTVVSNYHNTWHNHPANHKLFKVCSFYHVSQITIPICFSCLIQFLHYHSFIASFIYFKIEGMLTAYKHSKLLMCIMQRLLLFCYENMCYSIHQCTVQQICGKKRQTLTFCSYRHYQEQTGNRSYCMNCLNMMESCKSYDSI
jgi:hypothetical protein